MRQILCVAFVLSAAPIQAADATRETSDPIHQLLQREAPPRDWREYLRKNQTQRVAPELTASDKAFSEYWRWADPDHEMANSDTQMRLLEICERHPRDLESVIRFFSPDSPLLCEQLKKLHSRLVSERNQDSYLIAKALRDWLMLNSVYFQDDLIKDALGNEERTDEFQISAIKRLISVEPQLARQRLSIQQPKQSRVGHAVALGTLLGELCENTDAADCDHWRERLERIASDRTAAPSARRAAIRAVMGVSWPGRDEWFAGLFTIPFVATRDEYSNNDNPLIAGVVTAPEFWIPRLAVMLDGMNPIVRTHAVECLIAFQFEKARRDALLPLLPWIGDAKWVQVPNKYSRLRLLQSPTKVALPECIPYLKKSVLVDQGAALAAAAEALAHYQVHEAIDLLKSALSRETDSTYRRAVVRVLIKLNGFGPDEIASGLRDYALKVAEMPEEEWPGQAWDIFSRKPHDPLLDLGREVSQCEVKDDITTQSVLAEYTSIRKINPRAAGILSLAVVGWPTPASYQHSIERLREQDYTADWLTALIDAKTDFATALVEARDLRGAPAGIRAAIIGEAPVIAELLSGEDPAAKRALLACARLKRLQLPMPDVLGLLDGSDEDVAHAADQYLEALATPEARAELQKRARGQARILGMQMNFSAFEMEKGEISTSAESLRHLVLAPKGPEEVYGLLSEGNFGGDGQRALLIYKDRAVIRRIDANGRVRRRVITPGELGELRDWIARNKVADLPPYDEGTMDGLQLQYVHITRDGGERVFMNNPPSGPRDPVNVIAGSENLRPAPIVYSELTRRMIGLNEKPLEVVYESLTDLPGFRILHPREGGEVTRLDTTKGGLRAGIYINYDQPLEWHAVEAGGLAKEFTRGSVPDSRMDRWPEYLVTREGIEVEEGLFRGKRLWSGTRKGDEVEGLWASTQTGPPELIAKGSFLTALVCPGGEWIAVARTSEDKSWAEPNGVVRINLKTKRMFPVDLPAADNFDPLAWIESYKKVLLCLKRDEELGSAGPEKPEFYLLDPVSGEHEKVEGDFRAFERLDRNHLQPTGRTNEFWAVIQEGGFEFDRASVLGRYDTLHFRFTECLRFPRVRFESWDVRVDEKKKVVRIVVNGDLLQIKLPDCDASEAASPTPSQ